MTVTATATDSTPAPPGTLVGVVLDVMVGEIVRRAAAVRAVVARLPEGAYRHRAEGKLAQVRIASTTLQDTVHLRGADVADLISAAWAVGAAVAEAEAEVWRAFLGLAGAARKSERKAGAA